MIRRAWFFLWVIRINFFMRRTWVSFFFKIIMRLIIFPFIYVSTVCGVLNCTLQRYVHSCMTHWQNPQLYIKFDRCVERTKNKRIDFLTKIYIPLPMLVLFNKYKNLVIVPKYAQYEIYFYSFDLLNCTVFHWLRIAHYDKYFRYSIQTILVEKYID